MMHGLCVFLKMKFFGLKGIWMSQEMVAWQSEKINQADLILKQSLVSHDFETIYSLRDQKCLLYLS